MAIADATTFGGTATGSKAGGGGAQSATFDPHSEAAAEDYREKFLPISRHTLIDRLTQPRLWPSGDAAQARRFMRYLDYWRRHSYAVELLELEQSYEPFNPDSDLLSTRTFTPDERLAMQKRLVSQMTYLLQQANFTRVNPQDVQVILTKDSHYGLDLHVDLHAFEEILICYRGATMVTASRRSPKKLFLGKIEVKIPVFQRLFLLFKLKPEETRIREVMEERKVDRREAERIVRRLRGLLPASVKSDCVYIKLFKNIPRSDVEMIFPNTKVRFRLLDKIKFGLTASSGVGMGLFGTVGKIAVASNPIALAGAVATLCGVAFRQGVAFINQRNRYMIIMAQNLYFHAMADNRGVMTLLADRAAEEDVKEEMLLYSALAKEPANIRDLADIDHTIEQYLHDCFGLKVNFDVADALARLKQDGVVTELADGTLEALPPERAASHIDRLWDACLNELPDPTFSGSDEIDQAVQSPMSA